jgi:hypothetical protein
MIGFTRRPQPLDIDDTIKLLATDPRQRAASFPLEREIRLFQFKTWIYFPETEMVHMAGRIVGTLYLMRLTRYSVQQPSERSRENTFQCRISTTLQTH